jgi:hypothetical protein
MVDNRQRAGCLIDALAPPLHEPGLAGAYDWLVLWPCHVTVHPAGKELQAAGRPSRHQTQDADAASPGQQAPCRPLMSSAPDTLCPLCELRKVGETMRGRLLVLLVLLAVVHTTAATERNHRNWPKPQTGDSSLGDVQISPNSEGTVHMDLGADARKPATQETKPKFHGTPSPTPNTRVRTVCFCRGIRWHTTGAPDCSALTQ